MGNVGRSLVNQLQWFHFQHEAKKFLVGFCLKDDWFSVYKPSSKEYFIWWKVFEACIPKDETVVHVADVADEYRL